MSTKELSKIFNVSEVTIRNDLNELSRQGLVIRNYGGAIITGGVVEKRAAVHPTLSSSVSERIAEKAARLVNDGDVIFLDSSPLSRAMAEHLSEREHLTVFTNSIPLSERLADFEHITIYLIGGKVNNETRSTAGDSLDGFLAYHHISKAFLGCWGITEEQGLTDDSAEEAAVKKIFVKEAKEVIGLIESSRWGLVSLSSFASIRELHVVVTDAGPGDLLVKLLHNAGVRVMRIDREEGRQFSVQSPYGYFETLRADGDAEKYYTDLPGRGKKIAFANGMASEPFCADIERSFLHHAELAGFAPEDIYIFDNAYDETKALENAEAVIVLKPDVFVEFQLSAKVNNIIAAKMEFHCIPMVALEIPIPSAPFVGVNNWQAGTMAGDFAAEIIRTKFGGIEAIDQIVLIQFSIGSEINLFRTEAFAASLCAAFGEEVEEKIIREDCVSNTAEAACESMTRVLKKTDGKGKLAITTINHETMSGVIHALKQAGRWEPGMHVLVSQGCDAIGRAQIEEGSVDGSIGYFPEHYGRYILPAACALIQNKAIPPYIYVETKVISRDSLRVYYPTTALEKQYL